MSDAPTAAPAKSKRGGARKGAGRKKKGHTSPTIVDGIDLQAALGAPAPDSIEAEAQKYVQTALADLVKLMVYAASETVRVKAACDILDRGYGKPSVDAGGLEQMSLFTVGTPPELAKGIREEARKHANLAIEVLRKIGADGESESARRAANKAILDRGLGMVAAAKLEHGPVLNPGKKQQAQEAAQAATREGPYSPIRPPAAQTLQ